MDRQPRAQLRAGCAGGEQGKRTGKGRVKLRGESVPKDGTLEQGKDDDNDTRRCV